MRARGLQVVLALAGLSVAGALDRRPSVAADAPAALARYDLQQGGRYWVSREERQLQRLLRRAERTLKTANRAEVAWRKEIDTVDATLDRLAALQKEYEQQAKLLASGNLSLLAEQRLQERQGALAARLGKVRGEVLALDRPDDPSDVRKAAARFAISTSELDALVNRIGQLDDAMRLKYRALTKSQEIRDLLSTSDLALGPRQSYDERIAEFEESTSRFQSASEQPVLFKAGTPYVRCAFATTASWFAVENGELPVTLVPSSLAETFGALKRHQAADLLLDNEQIRGYYASVAVIRLGRR